MRTKALVGAMLAATCFLSAWPAGAADWPQWRGLNRDGFSAEVPAQLPEKKLLWSQPLSGEANAGIVVAGGFVVVADHAPDQDVIRCFRADTGAPAWKYAYANKAKLDYGAAPCATPCIAGGLVYTQSMVGDLYCFQLATGKIVWQSNLKTKLGGKVPQYGYTSSPLVVDGRLIVNPGGATTSLVALDAKTGAVAWKSPGKPAAYSSFIVAELGGKRQIVGYDNKTLGGWDPATGKRLWMVANEDTNDYNVGTPLVVDGKLIVSTDANKTRLFTFEPGGKIVPKPAAINEDLAPDMASPVVVKGMVFGPSGGLQCLDAADDLKVLWRNETDPFCAFEMLIAGTDRLMVFNEVREGEKETLNLFLLAPEKKEGPVLGSMVLCGKSWSHPALADGRLYVRDAKKLYCYAMK